MSFDLKIKVDSIVQNRPRKEGSGVLKDGTQISYKNSLLSLVRKVTNVPDDDFGFVRKEVSLEIEFRCESVDHLKHFYQLMEEFSVLNIPFELEVLPKTSDKVICVLPTRDLEKYIYSLMSKK